MTYRFYARWLIGGIVVLLIVAGACYFWYQHDIAPYKQEAAEAEKLLRQSQKSKKVSKTGDTAQQATDVTPAESSTPPAEKQSNDATPLMDKTEPSKAQSNVPAEIAETADVRVSPFGFGPYPEIPADFPIAVSWQFPDDMFPTEIQRQGELLSRVLIKLFNEGDYDFIAGKWHKGKVYPIYPNTFYVEVNEDKIEVEGKTLRTETIRILGPSGTRDIQKRLEKAISAGETLPGVRVHNMHEHGIDPFHYLFSNKGE